MARFVLRTKTWSIATLKKLISPVLVSVLVSGVLMAAESAAPTPEPKADVEKSSFSDSKTAVDNSRDSDACIVDDTAVDDLRKRREELEKRARELANRESELKAREDALEEQIKRISDIRDEVVKEDQLKAKGSEEKVNKLVETFETMSPKASAGVIATLDETLAVAAMQKMATPKLAKIMNLMEPSKSSHLSELLAGVARASRIRTVSNDAAAATTQMKGGEKNGNSSNENGNATNERNPAGNQKK